MSMEEKNQVEKTTELDDFYYYDDQDVNESECSTFEPRRSRRRRGYPTPVYNFKCPSFLERVYDVNYWKNAPLLYPREDEELTETETLASLKSLKEGISEEQCKKDAVMLSKKVCDEFSNDDIPLSAKDSIEDKRLRAMEEEIRINLIGFIELCTNQVFAPTKSFTSSSEQVKVPTKYGRSLATYNHPVPKFWC